MIVRMLLLKNFNLIRNNDFLINYSISLMKSLKFLPIFILFSFSNLYAQTNYKDNIVDNKSKYAGVYEGDLDIFLCCEMTETIMGTITFYFDGNEMKCIYDGLICSEASFVKNEFKCTATHYQFDINGNFVQK